MDKIEILKSKMQAVTSSYIADRDIAIAEFNTLLLSEKVDVNGLKFAIDKIKEANAGIREVDMIWRSMISSLNLDQPDVPRETSDNQGDTQERNIE